MSIESPKSIESSKFTFQEFKSDEKYRIIRNILIQKLKYFPNLEVGNLDFFLNNYFFRYSKDIRLIKISGKNIFFIWKNISNTIYEILKSVKVEMNNKNYESDEETNFV